MTLRLTETELEGPLPTLCDEDAALLDAVLAAREAHGVSPWVGPKRRPPGPLPTHDPARLERLDRLMALLDTAAAPDESATPPADLAQRAMERVREARQRERFAQQVEMLSAGPRGMGISFRQFAAAAAVFLLAATLLLPVLAQNLAEARRVACLNNLGTLGEGLGQYAAANAGFMPRLSLADLFPSLTTSDDEDAPRRAMPRLDLRDGDPATTVGRNIQHVYLLVRGGFTPASALTCPGEGGSGRSCRRRRDFRGRGFR